MTLVLILIAPGGIAMAADAALTETWGGHSRVLHGCAKLFAHPASLSGVGIWGDAVVPHPEPDKTPIALEFAIREFLAMERGTNAPEDLVRRLTDWLNGAFPISKRRIGIDVASLDRGGDGLQPLVWRIQNSPSLEAEVGRFRLWPLRRRGPFNAESDDQLIVAGEVNANVWVAELRAAIRRSAARTFSHLPQDLSAMRRQLAMLVRAVSDIYQVANLGVTIGGPVRPLTSTPPRAPLFFVVPIHERPESSPHENLPITGFPYGPLAQRLNAVRPATCSA